MVYGSSSGVNGPSGRRSLRRRGPARPWATKGHDEGFTLVELLLVTTIIPLIIGALAVGIVAVFKLQSSVSNRLGDTTDSQQVSAVYSKDITAAQYVTTDANTNPQCGAGTGTLVLSLDDNVDMVGGTLPVISYVLVKNANSSPVTYDLERLACNGVNSPTPSSTTILAYDVSATTPPPTVDCSGSGSCQSDPSAGWLSTVYVNDITYAITEQATGYIYSLTASPVNSTTSFSSGTGVSLKAQTSCNTADPGSGSLASNLCFVDFAQLATNPALWAAATTGSDCGAQMSATVGSSETLYFCLRISVTPKPATLLTPTACLAAGTNGPAAPCVAPTGLPNYYLAFLGGCYPTGACTSPFYTGIAGSPAIWLNSLKLAENTTATISLTNIHLNNAAGGAATGWQIISADAESTDSIAAEYITWSTPSATPLTPVCNGESWDNCTPTSGSPDYWGIACLDDQPDVGLVQTNTGGVSSITCNPIMGSERETGGQKDGAGMVEAVTPSSLTVTMGTYNGKQAISVGLLLSGVS